MTAPLAVSLGDPAGIGPELLLRAWSARGAAQLPPFAAAGGEEILREASKGRIALALIDDLSEAKRAFTTALPVLRGPDGAYTPGEPQAHGARFALQSLRLAVDCALAGAAGGVVTGPVAKSALAAIAPDFVGQTEYCATACGQPVEDAVMLLAGPSVKAVPLTVHCALEDVPARITTEVILHRTRIVARAMHTDFGLASPRIAMAGLNPHAGESGRMGREEIQTIAPAIAQLRMEGIDITGPYPADTLFAPHMRPTYDVAIAMYHDQALAPMKALDFDQGVNMTLGLPILRTSPDHGTAFDIAGKGIANVDSLIAAMTLAGEVAIRRAGGR